MFVKNMLIGQHSPSRATLKEFWVNPTCSAMSQPLIRKNVVRRHALLPSGPKVGVVRPFNKVVPLGSFLPWFRNRLLPSGS